MIPAYSIDPQRQYHIQVAKGEVGRYVLMPGDPKRCAKIAQYVLMPGDPKRCAKIAQYFDDPVLIADSREYVTITGTVDGHKVSAVSTGIGGPSAAIALEELVNCGADTFIRVGTCGGMQQEVLSGDLVIASGAIRMDGASREYAPIEYPAVCDYEVLTALDEAAGNLDMRRHIGVVHCKDAFYGQHNPELLPQSAVLLQKWDAYMKMGCLASEMESATLFIVGGYRKVRTGTVLLTMANQTRAKLGLSNPIVHDTDSAIRTAIEAVRVLIRRDGQAG